jgi:hypothetical protein
VTVGLLKRAGASGAAVDAGPSHDYLAAIRTREIERFRELIEELKSEERIGLAAVSVAARELSALAERMGRVPGQEDRT